MRFKAELHRDVVWFVQKNCHKDAQDAFYRQLELIRSEPIKNSEPMRDPKLSPYMLRFFRFGDNLAIFECDLARMRIRVLECRRLPQKPKVDSNRGEGARGG